MFINFESFFSLMHVTDWLPTLLSMAGNTLNISKSIDGIDHWPSLRYNKPSPRDEMLYNIFPNVVNSTIKEELNSAGIR